MGGRSRYLGKNSGQISISDEENRIHVLQILKETTEKRKIKKGNKGSEGSSSNQLLHKKCICCGEYTLPVNSNFEICPNCGWVDDPFQNKHPQSTNGRNPISLIEARDNYMKRI